MTERETPTDIGADTPGNTPVPPSRPPENTPINTPENDPVPGVTPVPMPENTPAGAEDPFSCGDARCAPEGALTETGFLTVSAGTANKAFPVTDARAEVWLQGEDGEFRLYRTLNTGASGISERTDVPTPPAALSQTPGSRILPYTAVRVRIFRDGYYPMEAREVPVFSGITSLQYFDLIPMAEGDSLRDPSGELIIVSESTGNAL